jgi:hypothetical protein
MSLAELMPAVQSLSRNEKAELKRLLDSELAIQGVQGVQVPRDEDEGELLRRLAAAAQIDIPRPGESYEAAAILRQFLESENSKNR